VKTVLVTGVTGFLGSHIARALVQHGYQVHGTKRATSNLVGLSDLMEKVTFHDVDRIEDGQWLNGLPRLHAVLHFATNYGKEPNQAWSVFQINTILPFLLLQRSIAEETPLFLNADTCYQTGYGHLQAYTLSKQQCRQWGECLTKNSKARFVNLKLFHPYGPGDRPEKFASWIIHQCRGSGNIALTQGEQKKDFIYVEDVVKAVLMVLQSQDGIQPGFTEFECGRGTAISIRKFVEMVHRQTNSRAALNFGALPYRENEIMFSQANITKLQALGWRPEIDLEAGIRRTLQATYEHATLI
jgi:nucleoside-diphosphate-sugar epimerase